MANLKSEITSTFKVKIPLPFHLSPVFGTLDPSKQHIRIRLYHRLVSQFQNPLTKTIYGLPTIHIDDQMYTVVATDVANQNSKRSDQSFLTIGLKDQQSYQIGPFQLTFIIDKASQTIALKLGRIQFHFDCCKLEKIKLVQNQFLETQLRKIKMKVQEPSTGVLSMDSRQRLLIDTWKTSLPAVGVWIRGPFSLSSIQVYQAVSRFAKQQFKVKCTFDENQVSFIVLLLNQVAPEAHLLTLTQCSQSEQIKVQDCNQQIIDFWSESDTSGMEFTLRDRTNVEFYSPIKSIETQKLEQELSKIDERHNSPEFTRIDIREDLSRRVTDQEKEIANLKEEIAFLKKQLQRSLESGDKKSLIRSPQYQHWSSRRVLTPQRLQESDLKVGLSSKGSTNNTKSSDRFDETNEFRRARQIIMEADEPWDRVELIE